MVIRVHMGLRLQIFKIFVARARNKGGPNSTHSWVLLVVMVAADVLSLHGACVFLCCYVTSLLRRAAPNQIRGASDGFSPSLVVIHSWRAAPY